MRGALLARLSSHPSAPFEKLLGILSRVVRPGTTVVVVTAEGAESVGADELRSAYERVVGGGS